MEYRDVRVGSGGGWMGVGRPRDARALAPPRLASHLARALGVGPEDRVLGVGLLEALEPDVHVPRRGFVEDGAHLGPEVTLHRGADIVGLALEGRTELGDDHDRAVARDTEAVEVGP